MGVMVRIAELQDAAQRAQTEKADMASTQDGLYAEVAEMTQEKERLISEVSQLRDAVQRAGASTQEVLKEQHEIRAETCAWENERALNLKQQDQLQEELLNLRLALTNETQETACPYRKGIVS